MIRKITYNEYNREQKHKGGSTKEISYKNGLVLNEVTKDLNGTEIFTRSFFYENSHLTKIEETHHKELVFIKTYSYNLKGKLIQEIWKDISLDEVKFEMNLIEAENRIIESADGITTIKLLNDEGNVVEEIEPDDYITRHQYDGKHLVKTQIFDGGELILEESYFFDKDGKETGSKGFDYENNEEMVIKRTFSPTGKITLAEQFINEVPFHKTYYEYDENDRIIKMGNEELTDGELQVTEYFYD